MLTLNWLESEVKEANFTIVFCSNNMYVSVCILQGVAMATMLRKVQLICRIFMAKGMKVFE